MHLLYTDEVNIDPRDSRFFIYGGVVVRSENALELSQGIDEIRARYGYKPDEHLKFNTVERPSQITAESHRQAKKDLLVLAAEMEVTLLTSFILHSIATSPDEARLNEINRVCYHFDRFLGEKDSHGLVLVDRFTSTDLVRHLQEKFSYGILGFPSAPKYRLKHIVGYHVAAVGTSNLCSLVDVALGALRFAVNSASDERKREVKQVLMAQLAPLFPRDDSGLVSELGIFFSPRKIKITKYRTEYEELRAWLAAHGAEPRCLVGSP